MNESHTSITTMPVEMFAYMFDYLNPIELASLSATSQDICDITEIAWKALYEQLNVRSVEELPSYRITFFKLYRSLKQGHQEGALLLDQPVKTAQEFNLLYFKFRKTPQKIKELVEEVNNKLEWHDILLKGFMAGEQLRKAHLLTLEDIETQGKFASILQTKYGSHEAFIILAQNCLARNDCQAAIDILNNNLQDCHDRESIIMYIVFHYTKINGIHAAIDFLKGQTYDPQNCHIREAINYLIAVCYEQKQFLIIEKIIDNFNIESRLLNICNLIEAVLENHQQQEARRLFLKYPLSELNPSSRSSVYLSSVYKKMQSQLMPV